MMLDVLLAADLETDRIDRLLVRECAAQLDGRASSATVTALQRFGFSGARLYQLRCGRAARPYVVKINDRAEMLEEWQATQSIRPVFGVGEPVKVDLRDAGVPDVALGYPLVSTQWDPTRVRVVELGEYLFELRHAIAVDALENLYSTLFVHAHAEMSVVDGVLSDELRRYLRVDRSYPKLDQVFGRRASIPLFGAAVRDPRRWLAEIDQEPSTFHVSPIHGDLHGQNVLLDPLLMPRLIDFGWARRRGPTLVDFTVMEATVRFMRFPRHVDPTAHLAAQDALDVEFGHLTCARLTDGDPMWRCYQRAGDLISRIRASAREACGATWSFREYQAVLFATLVGLVGYETYPTWVVLHTLDHLGRLVAGA